MPPFLDRIAGRGNSGPRKSTVALENQYGSTQLKQLLRRLFSAKEALRLLSLPAGRRWACKRQEWIARIAVQIVEATKFARQRVGIPELPHQARPIRVARAIIDSLSCGWEW